MTAKEFLEGKTLTAVETVENLVINLVIDEAIYGLDVDTSTIEAGTSVVRTEDFSIEGDTLTTGDITVDLSTTDMLGNN